MDILEEVRKHNRESLEILRKSEAKADTLQQLVNDLEDFLEEKGLKSEFIEWRRT